VCCKFSFLKEGIYDADIGGYSPRQILSCISNASLTSQIQLMNLLPSHAKLDTTLEDISPEPIHSSIAVLDPLIFSQSDAEEEDLPASAYDARGYSSYARICLAALNMFSDDRQLAKSNLWTLRHIIAFSIYAQDYLAVPNRKSPVFSEAAFRFGLQDVVSKAQQVSAYLLNTTWNTGDLVARLQGKGVQDGSPSQFLFDIVHLSKEKETTREARVLKNVLQHVLDDAEKDDADQWTAYARTLEKTGMQTRRVLRFLTNR
jgi:E3 ubiquitin-protein ligase listerin